MRWIFTSGGGRWLMVMGSRSLGRVIFGLITTRSLVALMGLLILNYFTHHNEVMLLGHSDTYTRDKVMQVTFAYNHFGRGLIQRMPRCRHGYFHVVNNDYTHWEMYAIGGSASPTINSQGNRYLAPRNRFAKEVTKRDYAGHWQWKHWNWRSEGDLFLNGAFFTRSGSGRGASYARASSLEAKSSSLVGVITSNAGALNCRGGRRC
ncbi:hypothetical protein HID58_049400 [Brassica napus]|uniref:Pectate lyase n=5 Tax=Brassica TaxID=3705 RepID=A0ABQ8B4W7_BRANA|nr:hypothetical protein HID58_049400 [Brassica napus]